jgi:cobalt/nickel transport system permease protein
MNFESFSSGDSYIHRLDTRVKIITGLALIVVIALCQSFTAATAGLLAAGLLVISAQLSVRGVVKRLILVNGFVAFLWVTLPLTYPGVSLFSIGPISVSRDGVALAGLISIKTNGAVLVLIGLLATSSVVELGNALARLKMPPKLCLLLLFSYRYIFVIHQEYLRLVRAARLRCFKAGTNMHTYRTTGYLFGMTLVKSHHRAHRVKQAMMLRGFQGRFHALYGSTIGRAEIIFGLSALTGVISLIALELGYRP